MIIILKSTPAPHSAVRNATGFGAPTFGLSFAAVLIGYRIGTRFRRPAEIVGGLVLIGIGIQILVEHLTA